MRVTNNMINFNTQNNISGNKTLLDILNTQMSSHKKISRPSDDPVVAIRSLRLRSNLNDISQYVDKNIPDAASWMKVTESALVQTEKVLEEMYKKCIAFSTQSYDESNKSVILEELKNLKDQIYAESNADYAGRTIFTGYKTNSDLTFRSQSSDKHYSITETFCAGDLSQQKYVSGLVNIDTTNPTTILPEDMPKDSSYYRLRLAYDNLDGAGVSELKYQVVSGASLDKTSTNPGVTINDANGKELANIQTTVNADGSKNVQVKYTTDPTAAPVTQSTYKFSIDANGKIKSDAANPVPPDVNISLDENGNIVSQFPNSTTENYIDGSGVYKPMVTLTTTPQNKQVGSITDTRSIKVDSKPLSGTDDPYLTTGTNKVSYVEETGELVLSKEVYDILQNLTAVNGKDPISFTYEKTGFNKGDLYPEHYFDCTDMTNDDPDKWVTYHKKTADIEYNVSFNQKLKVNTEADEVFGHDIGRDIDEMINALSAVVDAQEKVDQLTSMKSSDFYSDAQKESIETMLEAANKEYDLAKNKLQKLGSNGETRFQGYTKQCNKAITDIGSRTARLEVIETRMKDQKSNFRELLSKNENRDMEDILLDYKAAYTAYESALTAASKVTGNSLLNYI